MSNTHTPSAADVTKEQLVRDFKVLVADAEALLKATAGQSGERWQRCASKWANRLRSPK